jgi:hypothetical protein
MLEIFAELFIGFTGFSGVIAALRGGQNVQLSETDKARIMILVSVSVMGIFASLLPMLLEAILGDTNWQLANGILGFFMLGSAVVGILWVRQRGIDRSKEFSRFFGLIAGSVFLSITTILCISGLDIGIQASYGIYCLGLSTCLFICAGMFVLLIRLVVSA